MTAVRYLAAVSCLLLATCSVTPKYIKPEAPVPRAYKEAAPSNIGKWKTAEPADMATRGNWWEVFRDPQLNEFEERLNVSNQNIAAAAGNVLAARAVQSRAQYFPSLAANPSIVNSRLSSAFGKAEGIEYTVDSLPFEASWEPDLFGRVKTTVQGNVLAAQTSVADLENVRLSAQAELATDYFELRAQDELEAVLRATVSGYAEALDLNRVLLASGVGADETVAQSESQLRSAQAQLTDLGVQRAQYEHAVAVLVGQPASEFAIPAMAEDPEPPVIPADLPSLLLERRPDIAAAERTMAQANAQIGLARIAFYPTVTLAATVGLENVSISNWFTWPARVWSLGPSLAETLFDAGARRAAVQQYQARYDAAVANYRETVLTAFQQVEDGLASQRILEVVVEHQNVAIQAARRQLDEAETRYQAGLDPYLNVITAQTALLDAEQAGGELPLPTDGRCHPTD